MSNDSARNNNSRSIGWRVGVALAACEFFTPLSHQAMAESIGKVANPNVIEPFSGANFMQYLEVTGWGEQWPRAHDVGHILRALVREGFLEHYSTGPVAPGVGGAFHRFGGTTVAMQPGIMWLAPVLGSSFLVSEVGPVTLPIVGTDANGDPHIGSGVALDSTHILTCAHVVTDMTLDKMQPRASVDGSPAGHPPGWSNWLA